MKQESTFLLKGIIFLVGLGVLAFFVFLSPAVINSERTGYYRPILFGMYLTAPPFFLALYQTFKLLTYIDKNKAFSDLSLKALNYIKYCAVIISVLYIIGMPLIFNAGDRDDPPGVILIGLLFIFIPIIIANFAAIFQKLIKEAINIKLGK